MECSTGIVGEACTRGQVFRTRFKYSEQYDDAEADWFVCRCNGGVMQFASTESFEAERRMGKVMGVHYAPADMQFSVRLHDQELLPAKWVDCWVGFREWLTTQTDFVKSRNMTEVDQVVVRQTFLNWTADAMNPLEAPFVELDRLILNQTAEPTYLEIRKKWQRECVGLQQTPQWEARSFLEPDPTDNWPGATDSAVDFFHLTNTSATSLSPYDWPTKSTWYHNMSAEYAAKASIPVEESTLDPEPLNDSPEPGPLDGQDASGTPQHSDDDKPPEEEPEVVEEVEPPSKAAPMSVPPASEVEKSDAAADEKSDRVEDADKEEAKEAEEKVKASEEKKEEVNEAGQAVEEEAKEAKEEAKASEEKKEEVDKAGQTVEEEAKEVKEVEEEVKADGKPKAKETERSQADDEPKTEKKESSEADDEPKAEETERSQADDEPKAVEKESSRTDDKPKAEEKENPSVTELTADDPEDVSQDDEETATESPESTEKESTESTETESMERESTVKETTERESTERESPDSTETESPERSTEPTRT